MRGPILMETVLEHTKTKKCDYCDEFAAYKVKEDELNTYLCDWCYHNIDEAKKRINDEEF